MKHDKSCLHLSAVPPLGPRQWESERVHTVLRIWQTQMHRFGAFHVFPGGSDPIFPQKKAKSDAQMLLWDDVMATSLGSVELPVLPLGDCDEAIEMISISSGPSILSVDTDSIKFSTMKDLCMWLVIEREKISFKSEHPGQYSVHQESSGEVSFFPDWKSTSQADAAASLTEGSRATGLRECGK